MTTAHSIFSIKSPLRFIALVLASLLIGFAIGRATYIYNEKQIFQHLTHEAEAVLSLTSSYVSAYSGIRDRHLNVDAPVPAKFRADVAREFNADTKRDQHFSAQMVGMPGRSIATPPLDRAMEILLTETEAAGNMKRISQLTQVNGLPVLRTIFPTIADKNSCVNCHNRQSGMTTTWKLGDMMGAYVIDRNVGGALVLVLRLSWMLGVLSFVVVILGGILAGQFQQLRGQSSKLKRLAETDSLTGCLNRRALYQHATHHQTGDTPPTGPHALLMMDLDHFKQINDQHGHAAGDEVLRQFAGLLRSCIRERDIVARIGGEEFIVYMPDSDSGDVLKVAHRICQRAAGSPVEFEGNIIRYTVSIGGVEIGNDNDPQTQRADGDGNGNGIERWINIADRHLYEAKSQGRNRVIFPFPGRLALSQA